jgi:hypothetical protein
MVHQPHQLEEDSEAGSSLLHPDAGQKREEEVDPNDRLTFTNGSPAGKQEQDMVSVHPVTNVPPSSDQNIRSNWDLVTLFSTVS